MPWAATERAIWGYTVIELTSKMYSVSLKCATYWHFPHYLIGALQPP